MSLTLTEVAVQVLADLRRLKPETIAASREAGQKGGEELGEGITRGADGKLRDSRGKFVAGGAQAGKGFAKGFGGEVDGTFARVAATMAARFALVGGAAAAAAPGVLQFAAALVPATGAALALPAALLSLKAASATVKVAVMGVGDAISTGFGDDAKKADKALDKLSGSARTFAKTVIALRPQVEGLQKAVSERFFLPFADDIRPLAQLYLPMLKTEMANLAGPLGGLAEQLAETGQRGLIFDTVRKVFDQTGLAAIRVRGAIDPLVTSLALLVRDTVGELPGLASGFSNAANRLAAFVSKASKAGSITNAFRNGVTVLKDFGAILANIGSIVGSVYSAATAGGNTLLANLRDLTEQAADFFQTAQGAGALQSVFGTLGAFGVALRTSLGAVLPAIAASLQTLAPAIAALAGPASQIVVALAPLLPLVAGIAATVLTALTPAIAGIAKYLSQNEAAVKTLVVALIAYKVALLASAGAAAVQAAGGLLAWVKATTIATNVSRVFTVVQYALGAAMRFALGPIGLIIAAVGLLVAAVVYAYKNHEGFRNLVQNVWSAIKKAVTATVDWFVTVAWPFMQRVFRGIGDAAIWLWEKAIRPSVQAIVGFWQNVLVPAAMWLWKNVLEPAFKAIGWAVKTYLAVAQLAAAVLVAFWKNVVAPAVMWLWKKVFEPVWKGIAATTRVLWTAVRAIFDVWVKFLRNVVAPAVMWLWKNVIRPAWNGVSSATKTLWAGLRVVFNAIVGFLRDKVAKAFRVAVDGIRTAWNRLREAARVPVAFVVNKVINPLIGGFNKVAGAFGTKGISPIGGFAAGGMPGFSGRIPGAASTVDDRRGSLVDRTGKLLGAITVASGEFIVNAKDTARALPLLRWINDGMKGGPLSAAKRIGRQPAERPGDGSEGWAFDKGGLAGFLGDVWDAVSNPKKAILAPVNAVLGKIPGGGALREILVGMGKKLASGFVSWLGGAGGGTGAGNVGKAQSFIRAQAGKPYVWASAGPRGYDCSGIVSAAWNILHGRSPYSHTFSTSSLPGKFFPKKGFGGPLTAGWAHPGQRGASANVGHMAGQFIGGMRFESTGSRGVRVGAAASSPLSFANVGHFNRGGIAQVARADFGSVTLKRGWNMIENRLGRPEHLSEGAAAGPTRLHPADIEALAQILGRVVAGAVGAGNYAAGRSIEMYQRGG